MILKQVASGSETATVHATNPTPSGFAEEPERKWLQKGDFYRQMSFATASIERGDL